jgi:tRNA-binding protein
MKPKKSLVDYSVFEQLDIRVGTIRSAKPFEKAIKPAYQLTVDFGDLGILNSSAQITTHYTPSQLIDKQVIAIVNFPEKQIANFFSQCLVLGVYNSDKSVNLITTDANLTNGSIVG